MEAGLRTLIDIPEEDLARIREITREQGISRAEYVRRALKSSLDVKLEPVVSLDDFFGWWTRNRPVDEPAEDGVAYQERLRREWDREWD